MRYNEETQEESVFIKGAKSFCVKDDIVYAQKTDNYTLYVESDEDIPRYQIAAYSFDGTNKSEDISNGQIRDAGQVLDITDDMIAFCDYRDEINCDIVVMNTINASEKFYNTIKMDDSFMGAVITENGLVVKCFDEYSEPEDSWYKMYDLKDGNCVDVDEKDVPEELAQLSYYSDDRAQQSKIASDITGVDGYPEYIYHDNIIYYSMDMDNDTSKFISKIMIYGVDGNKKLDTACKELAGVANGKIIYIDTDGKVVVFDADSMP